MNFYKYCPKCGNVNYQDDNECKFCWSEMIETNVQYKFTDWATNKSKIELDIMWKYDIESNPQFDKKLYDRRVGGGKPLIKETQKEDDTTKMLYCRKCGDITSYGSRQYDENYVQKKGFYCVWCNTILDETRFEHDDCYDDRGKLKPEIVQAIQDEYISKSPFYSEEAKQERLKKEEENRRNRSSSIGTICPYCKSTSVSPISTLNRAVSVGMLGLASGKIGKQYHCNACGSNF